jgi:hypothetical protein
MHLELKNCYFENVSINNQIGIEMFPISLLEEKRE